MRVGSWRGSDDEMRVVGLSRWFTDSRFLGTFVVAMNRFLYVLLTLYMYRDAVGMWRFTVGAVVYNCNSGYGVHPSLGYCARPSWK